MTGMRTLGTFIATTGLAVVLTLVGCQGDPQPMRHHDPAATQPGAAPQQHQPAQPPAQQTPAQPRQGQWPQQDGAR